MIVVTFVTGVRVVTVVSVTVGTIVAEVIGGRSHIMSATEGGGESANF